MGRAGPAARARPSGWPRRTSASSTCSTAGIRRVSVAIDGPGARPATRDRVRGHAGWPSASASRSDERRPARPRARRPRRPGRAAQPPRAHLLVSRGPGQARARPTRGSSTRRGSRWARWSGAASAGWPEPHPVHGPGAAVAAALRPGRPRLGPTATRSPPGRALPRRPAAGVTRLVMGYAETATALGHCVADALGAPGLHSTRRAVPGVARLRGVRGGALPRHRPPAAARSRPGRCWPGHAPLVLVDDEISTGATAGEHPRARCTRCSRAPRYVVAAPRRRPRAGPTRPADARSPTDLRHARRRGGPGRGRGSSLPRGRAARGEALVAAAWRGPTVAARSARGTAVPGSDVVRLRSPAPARAARRGGGTGRRRRTGSGWRPHLRARDQVRRRCGRLPAEVLVLGSEELMYVPLRLAERLADLVPRPGRVHSPPRPARRCSPSTTPGYAMRSAVAFPAHDRPVDGPGHRFAYNLASPASTRGRVVLVVDSAGDARRCDGPDGVLDALSRRSRAAGPGRPARDHRPTRATVPEPLRGPRLRLLRRRRGALAAHRPVRRRARGADRGARGGDPVRRWRTTPSRCRWSTSRPPSTRPLFADALAALGRRVAHAVGVVTERPGAAGAGRCWCRWPAPARRSGS